MLQDKSLPVGHKRFWLYGLIPCRTGNIFFSRSLVPLMVIVCLHIEELFVYVTFFREKSNQKTLSKRMLPPALSKTGKSCKRVPEMAFNRQKLLPKFPGREKSLC